MSSLIQLVVAARRLCFLPFLAQMDDVLCSSLVRS